MKHFTHPWYLNHSTISNFSINGWTHGEPAKCWPTIRFLREGALATLCTVTIIWAPQSGRSTEGTSCRGQVPQAQSTVGQTWVSGGASWAPPARSGAESRPLAILSYIHSSRQLLVFVRWNSAVCQYRDKSGTPSQKWGKWASRENSDFFLGLVVENRDCPGKEIWDGWSPYFTQVSNNSTQPPKVNIKGTIWAGFL